MRTLNERLVIRLLGYILFSLNSLLLVYLGVAFLRQDILQKEFFIGLGVVSGLIIISLIMYGMGLKSTRKLEDINIKDAVLVVLASWVMLVFVGGLPYFLQGLSWVDAVFESASGFTTTGSTIFTDIESLPASLLLWRSATQWLGGMGIILFFVSVIPSLGSAGKTLFSYEVPGPIKEARTPHIRDTARILWLIYLTFTLTLVFLLKLEGMTWFDAVNHAFTTLSTGGFSTKNDSLMSFSPTIQWTITFFMLIGGTNFGLYQLLLSHNRKDSIKDIEVRWYFSFILFLTIIFTLWVFFTVPEKSFEENFRHNAFTVIAMVTTTGYANVDYELFPVVLQAILLLTLFTGGSAGSTSGGVKFYRIVLLFRSLSEQIKHSLTPNLVSYVRVGGHLLKEEVIFATFVFFSIYVTFVLLGAIFFTAIGLDFTTAFTATATFIGNVGPGFSTIGPTENFVHFSDISKLFGAFLMILGRLEFFTVLTILHRAFWREN